MDESLQRLLREFRRSGKSLAEIADALTEELSDPDIHRLAGILASKLSYSERQFVINVDINNRPNADVIQTGYKNGEPIVPWLEINSHYLEWRRKAANG